MFAKSPILAVWLLPEYATDGNLQYLAIELYQTLNGLSSDIGKDVFPLNTSLNLRRILYQTNKISLS